MPLASLKETYPDYRNTFKEESISHLDDYSVYANNDKVGSVEDGLFDSATGQFRYLVVDTGSWIFGKKVLMPMGLAQFDTGKQRINAAGLTKEQVENLPEYNGLHAIDHNYEERVRGVYRENAVGQSAPVSTENYATAGYSYEQDAELYTLAETEERNQPIRLYEERLVADKARVKAGSVSVGKRVESETASVSIPVEKEQVVIERTAPTKATVTTDHAFAEGEVARVEVFEEKANVSKEAVLREEVTVRKETQQDTYTEEKTIRREELDVETEGNTEITNK